MGRYASYGIIDTFSISLDSLDECIRRSIWGKSLKDFDIDTVISQFPTDIYDVEQNDDYLSFSLKKTVTSKDIISVMAEFFEIFPRKFENTENLFKQLSPMTMDQLRMFARQKVEENFQVFSLYGRWYGMKVELGDKILYPGTDVEGFMIHSSYSKMIVEDDISPFDFLTELIRYRLQANPLSGTLLSFLSE